jgi:hypothetical protein
VNQYRRRDVLTYLALRYYVDNEAARTDHWAREIATELVLTCSDLAYFQALHFKELSQRQAVDHRQMLLPGAKRGVGGSRTAGRVCKASAGFRQPLMCVQLSAQFSRRPIRHLRALQQGPDTTRQWLLRGKSRRLQRPLYARTLFKLAQRCSSSPIPSRTSSVSLS